MPYWLLIVAIIVLVLAVGFLIVYVCILEDRYEVILHEYKGLVEEFGFHDEKIDFDGEDDEEGAS